MRVGPILLVSAALALTACGSFGDPPPSWQASPALGARGGPGAEASPIVPVPAPTGPQRSGPTGGGTGSGTAPSGRPTPTGGAHVDPNVVATHLVAPVGLTLLPDGSALVGERTTGRIVRVQPEAGKPVPTVRTLHGLDTSGDGGLLDLALSPTYAEDGLIYAYVTTAKDNRVVDFTLTGPVTPVFTGIPKGHTGNTGRITFGADGDLYVGTGDTGRPTLANDSHSLAGKVLRLNAIGDPAAGNPTPSSPVWTSGHRIVNGLCAVPQTSWLLEAEAGTARSSDEVNLLERGGFYGWPVAIAGAQPPVGRLPAADSSPGGCAVQDGRAWVTSLHGQALLVAPLRATTKLLALGEFSVVLVHRYGRLKTVVAAPDGALWLTTSNRDGHGTPVAADERVIRYLPSASAGNSPV